MYLTSLGVCQQRIKICLNQPTKHRLVIGKYVFFSGFCSVGERLLLLICFFNFENRVVIMLANYFVFSCLQVKHDHEDCRVMYREGLEGSPFHTLLVEGYMDGPIQDCKSSFN